MDSLTVKELDLTGLRALVQLALALPDGTVREANKPFPVGQAAFVTVEHHTDSAWGPASRSWNGTTEKSTLRANNQGKVTINAYGVGAFRLLNKLKTLLSADPTVKSKLRKLNLGLLYQSEVRNISALASPTYEERAVYDIDMTYTLVVETNTKRVDVAQVNIGTDTSTNKTVITVVRP